MHRISHSRSSIAGATTGFHSAQAPTPVPSAPRHGDHGRKMHGKVVHDQHTGSDELHVTFSSTCLARCSRGAEVDDEAGWLVNRHQTLIGRWWERRFNR